MDNKSTLRLGQRVIHQREMAANWATMQQRRPGAHLHKSHTVFLCVFVRVVFVCMIMCKYVSVFTAKLSLISTSKLVEMQTFLMSLLRGGECEYYE